MSKYTYIPENSGIGTDDMSLAFFLISWRFVLCDPKKY